MKILITGATGQLGSELVQQSQSQGFAVQAPPRRQMDITDRELVKNFIHLHQPSLIINAAAYTDVDKAETDDTLAFAVNKTGCANLAHICADIGIPLVQISTDYVFDGKKGTPYRETDPISPLGVYGRSKAEGEKEIRSCMKEHIILRTSWLYGINGINFVKTMLKLAREKEVIRVVADQYGSPTSAADLAEAIMIIADRLRNGFTLDWGTYHFCGRGIISWYEFATTIVALARLHSDIKTTRIEPIATADYPTEAKRPAFSALDCSRIRKHFGIHAQAWQKSLKMTIKRLISAGNGAEI